jgi:hypothetical protein
MEFNAIIVTHYGAQSCAIDNFIEVDHRGVSPFHQQCTTPFGALGQRCQKSFAFKLT